MKIVLFCFHLVLSAAPNFAQEIITINENNERELKFSVGEKKDGEYLPESFIQSLIPDQKLLFRQYKTEFVNFTINSSLNTFTEYLLWTGKEKRTWVFYRSKGQNSFSTIITGRLVPYPENKFLKFQHNTNKVKIGFEPNVETEVFIIYQRERSPIKQFEFTLVDYEYWLKNYYIEKYTQNIEIGVLYGILMAVALINFIFYLVHKERNYFIYTAYLICYLFYDFNVYGLLVQHTALSYYRELEFILDNLFLNGSLIFYLYFLMNFIDVGNYPPWEKIIRSMIGVLAIGIVVVTIVFGYFEDIYLGYLIRNLFILSIIPPGLIFLFKLYNSKVQTDRIFFFGSLVLLAFGVYSILNFLYAYAEYSDDPIRIGIVMEGMIFSAGIGVKVRITNQQNIESQRQLIGELEKNDRLQKTLNHELEEMVSLKTDQLKQRNLELENIRNNLELEVDQRTNEVIKSNQDLVHKNQQLEQYAFITAHHLRSPVARLKGLINLFHMTNQSNDNDGLRQIIPLISETTEDMDQTLHDLNKVLQVKSHLSAKIHFSFNDTFRKITTPLKEQLDQNNIKIKTDLKIDLLFSNKAYFHSIFYNLISNAVKFRRDDVESQINIKNYCKNNTVTFIIADNGNGVDLDRFGNKIFGLYQRFHLHVDGKGVGLFMVKSQVEALGGSISVESEPFAGSSFKIDFPSENILECDTPEDLPKINLNQDFKNYPAESTKLMV